jgi:hypothetical protein
LGRISGGGIIGGAGLWRFGACSFGLKARPSSTEAAHPVTLVSESLTHGPAPLGSVLRLGGKLGGQVHLVINERV